MVLGMILVSERLKTIARCAGRCHVLADVGTDHAYLPIYVRENGIADCVIAMDVRKKPLERAARNIREAGCDGIELRLSDGLRLLTRGEAQVVTISGMGGELMERILVDGRGRIDADTRLCLSPQSEITHFRYFLRKNGFDTQDEVMLSEDGKTYVIITGAFGKPDEIHAVGKDERSVALEQYVLFRYGEVLLRKQDKELVAYLDKEGRGIDRLMGKLKEGKTAASAANVDRRLQQLAFDREANRLARDMVVWKGE
jgi:tRNA (adenine22-N1)-methyltransferase